MIVLYPFYIVFPEIVPRLYFDENCRKGPRIVKAVEPLCGDVQAVSTFKKENFLVEGNLNSADEHKPVLPTPFVPLQARSEPGIDDDPFDLVILFIGQNLVVPPGAMFFFHETDPFGEPVLRIFSNLPVPAETPAWN